jgi:spore maturation protein CgeB
MKKLKIVFLGLSITSSWGNGHATTYRGLIKYLSLKGHDVVFLERDLPWYAENRDLPNPPFCRTFLYKDLTQLKKNYLTEISDADFVIVGSYVPEGVEVGNIVINNASGITAFYDIDTPVTISKLKNNDFEYLHPSLIEKYNLYLSFTGGPFLEKLAADYGAQLAFPLYCSFDPEIYYPQEAEAKWDLGYLGTYSSDRQASLKNILISAAEKDANKKFVVAGAQYPDEINWNENIERINHLPPALHRKFYNSQRFTLNITRKDMIEAGYSPSVRLFEAAGCGTPIISDYWVGLDYFFSPGEEIFISSSTEGTLQILNEVSENERRRAGEKAMVKVRQLHSAAKRSEEILNYYSIAAGIKSDKMKINM